MTEIKLDGVKYEARHLVCGCLSQCYGWDFLVDDEPYGNIENAELYDFVTEAMETIEKQSKIIDDITLRLTSGNDVPVDRIIITPEMWKSMLSELIV